MAKDEDRPTKGEGALIKAPTKQLAEKINSDIGEHVVSSFRKLGKLSAKVSIDNETRITYDMTPEHANAVKEMKRFEFAVPEQERTARSVQQTTRLKIAAVVAAVGTILIYLKPEAGWPIVGVVGILETGIVAGEFVNREKGKKLPRGSKD